MHEKSKFALLSLLIEGMKIDQRGERDRDARRQPPPRRGGSRSMPDRMGGGLLVMLVAAMATLGESKIGGWS